MNSTTTVSETVPVSAAASTTWTSMSLPGAKAVLGIAGSVVTPDAGTGADAKMTPFFNKLTVAALIRVLKFARIARATAVCGKANG